MYNHTKEAAMRNECTSIVGHFNGHSSAPKQYRQHRPMRHVQGYPGSHWMPPSSNYSLRIAPVAARATENKTMMTTCNNFAAFLMAMAMHQYVTAYSAQWK